MNGSELTSNAPLNAPITILDFVHYVTGNYGTYSNQDHYRAGVNRYGVCHLCQADIASYNAYPSTSGHWRCADCIGQDGYRTAEEYAAALCDDSPEKWDYAPFGY